jgi:predicted helicase
MVNKVGDNLYWDHWAKSVAEIAEKQIDRLTNLVKEEGVRGTFNEFLSGLQQNINPEITKEQAVAASASREIIERYQKMPEMARKLLKNDVKSSGPGPSQKEGLATDDLQRRRLLSEAAVIKTMYDPTK